MLWGYSFRVAGGSLQTPGAERTTVIPRVAPYRPGEFYLRELPPLRAVLDGLSGLGLLVVDGYADLDPAGLARPGRACARRVRHPPAATRTGRQPDYPKQTRGMRQKRTFTPLAAKHKPACRINGMNAISTPISGVTGRK